MTKLFVFYNLSSGKAGAIDELRQALLTSSSHWIELTRSTDLAKCVADAVAEGCESIVAAGGDGTVNALVNALMGVNQEERPALAIIPLGTANDFAGTLCIPDDVADAAELIQVPAIPVDVVRIRGAGCERYYANIAAGGNCVRVSEALSEEVKERWGAFSYLRGAIDVLPDMTTYRITARCDEEEFADLDCWAILVANGKTNAGHIEVAPKASPVDGLMDVILIRDGTIADMIQIVANNLLGDFLASDQVIFRQVKSLYLQSQPPMRFALDGEVMNGEPVQFDVIPSAIRMHVGNF